MSANYVKLFPIVYVVNSTNEVLKDIYFTYEGISGKDVRFKKISKNSMESEAIVTMAAKTYKKLFMYHHDKDNVRHEYLITNRLVYGNNRDMRIEVLDIKADGTYELRVEHNFILG